MIDKQQQKIIGKFAIGIVALLVIFVSYNYIIPRTEVEIDTVYHSSYSSLFVQSKISNSGTKEVSDMEIKMSVWNKDELLKTETHYPGVLKSKQTAKLPALLFDGSHSEDYELIISMNFIVDDDKNSVTYYYKIADYGNLAWHDQYSNL